MITKTASEIINGAMQKAGVFNVDFLTMQTLTNELNNAYRTAYQDIAMSDSTFYCEKHTLNEDDWNEDTQDWSLPKDLYIIKSVAFLGQDGFSRYEIPRCPPKEAVPGTYTVEKSRLKYFGQPTKPIVIEYVKAPQTVTCPATSEPISIDGYISEYGLMTEEGFHYKWQGQSLFYYFSDGHSEEKQFKEARKKYGNGEIIFDYNAQTIHYMVDGELEYDLTPDYEVGENKIASVHVHHPYMMVGYEDGTIVVAQNGNQTLWNIKAATGHETRGKIHGLCTNDKTLYGCIYEDEDGQLFLASFVPDTIMNYPTNALFNYLEVNLACLLMSMNGAQNEYLSGQYRDTVASAFASELKQIRANPVRISNQRYPRGRLVC